jgi:hypothetical protein
MAFTGTAVVKQVTDRQVRITGLSLGAGASGTIGLNGATGTAPGVTLPASFQPQVYDYGTSGVTLADSISCSYAFVDTSGVVSTPLTVAKTGTTVADFRITLATNGSATSPFEIYVRFHD